NKVCSPRADGQHHIDDSSSLVAQLARLSPASPLLVQGIEVANCCALVDYREISMHSIKVDIDKASGNLKLGEGLGVDLLSFQPDRVHVQVVCVGADSSCS